MGIELHPKFLSLTETRCYRPLYESIVAKVLPKNSTLGLLEQSRRLPFAGVTVRRPESQDCERIPEPCSDRNPID